MKAYVQPILLGFLFCLILWRILLIPATIYQYRKFGKQSTQRSLFLSMFLLYMICAYFLVILPLPAQSDVTNTYKDMIQPIPFMFVSDFFKELPWIIEGLPRTILSGPITQPIFNVILVIPFGMFLRVYFKQPIKRVILYSFLLSLFYELTQLSGLYGIYSGPYRLFDVDDLLLNTLGGLVGYYSAPLITKFFPETVSSSDAYIPGDVTYIRRLIAYSIDLFIIRFFSDFFGSFSIVAFIVIYFVYFIFLPKNTFGQRIVNIELKSKHGDLKRRQKMKRYLLLFLTFHALPWILKTTETVLTQDANLYILAPFIYLFGILGLYGFVLTHAWYMRKKAHRILFFDSFSQTEMYPKDKGKA